jgi:hypothetical protein
LRLWGGGAEADGNGERRRGVGDWEEGEEGEEEEEGEEGEEGEEAEEEDESDEAEAEEDAFKRILRSNARSEAEIRATLMANFHALVVNPKP